MKRGFEETSSSQSHHSKYRKTNHNGRDHGGEDLVRKVAEHYSSRSNQTPEEREASPIIHLKKLNNWIKSVLIQMFTKKGDVVLDLACGKGGDLIKWDKARIGYYVGVDIAEGSIEDCRTRYNGEADPSYKRKKFSFPARLICADCYEVSLDKELVDDAPFDICSCQFALHYSWSTEERARRALANVSALLRPGGRFIGTMPDANVIVRKLRDAEGLSFGNTVFWVTFGEEYAEKKFKTSKPFGIQYKFHLEMRYTNFAFSVSLAPSKDAVDCPEWLVPFHVFESLAREYDLELEMKMNSHDFVHDNIKKMEYADLMRRLGALGNGNGDGKTLSKDEWEAAYLYMVFVLKKKGHAESVKNDKHVSPGPILEEQIVYL